jgi:hypothetical protein
LIQAINLTYRTLFIAEVSNCDHNDTTSLMFFSSRYHNGPGAAFER